MKRFALLIALILPIAAHAQIANLATTGMVAPLLSGNGSPALAYACNAIVANVPYIQLDALNGRLWLCDYSTGAWAWDHLITPLPITQTSALPATPIVPAGCTTTPQIAYTGAAAGMGVFAALVGNFTHQLIVMMGGDVVAPGQITLTYCNLTVAAITPASGLFIRYYVQ